MSYFFDIDPRGPGSNWVRTSEGWRHVVDGQVNDTSTFALSTNVLGAAQPAQIERSHHEQTKNDDENSRRQQERAWQPYLGQVKGHAGLRKTTESLSDAFRKLEVYEIATSIRGFAFCAEFLEKLLTEKLSGLSGTTLKEMFRILQGMLDLALESETHIVTIRKVLNTAAESLEIGKGSMVGSRRLWKNHSDIVNNMITQVGNFNYTEREENGLPMLLDLPKECLHNILLRLSDHRDLASVRGTCGYLRELCDDPSVWRELCFLHFSEKQMYNFILDSEYLSTDWESVFKSCRRKHKTLRTLYGDELYFCNLCRVVYWKKLGHPCAHTKKTPSSSCLSPNQFIDMIPI